MISLLILISQVANGSIKWETVRELSSGFGTKPDGTGLVVWNTPLHKTMAAVRDL